MRVLAIDPGTRESGFVVLDTDTKKVLNFGKWPNNRVKQNFLGADHLAIEQIKSYGNVMGDTTIETCVWIGRFIERWGEDTCTLIPRKTICAHVCGNPRAKDSNIRRAVLDRYAELFSDELGGGREPALGMKNKPGPLYGMSRDVFSALALALTFADTRENESQDFLK